MSAIEIAAKKFPPSPWENALLQSLCALTVRVAGRSQLHFEIIAPLWNNTWSTGRTVFIICQTFFFFFAKILIVPDSPTRHVNEILSSHILLQHSKYWYLEKKQQPETSNSVLNILIDFFFYLLLFMPKLLWLPGRNTYKGTKFSAGVSILLIMFQTNVLHKIQILSRLHIEIAV